MNSTPDTTTPTIDHTRAALTATWPEIAFTIAPAPEVGPDTPAVAWHDGPSVDQVEIVLLRIDWRMDPQLSRTYSADAWDHIANVLEEATWVPTPRRPCGGIDWDAAAHIAVCWAPRPVQGRADFMGPERLDPPESMAARLYRLAILLDLTDTATHDGAL